MTPEELDQLVDRMNSIDGDQPGFRNAYVVEYSPAVIGIEFDDNATAELYAFAKQTADVRGIAVDPPNGSTVLWRR